MGSMLVACALAFALVTVIAAVSARITRPWWRASPHLGAAFGVLGVGVVCWVQFMATWLSPLAGSVVAIVIAAVFVAAFGAFRLWRWIRRELGLVLLAGGLLAAYVGFTYLWATGPIDGFSLAALRFSFHDEPYPIDNLIPTLFANRLHDGGGAEPLVLSWHGSDRPPLLSGGILLGQELFAGIALPDWLAIPMAIGMVLNLLWVPALWALLRFAGVNGRVAALTTAFAGATATMLINTTYTWPKLLSAALIIVAMTLLLAAIRRRIGIVVGLSTAALAVSLAALAHGAALFSLPAIAILAVMALRRGGRWLSACAVSAAAVLITYAPWVYYQRVIDPPGDRLLKWHLAGVTDPTGRTVGEEIRRAYESVTLGEWFDARLVNLRTIFSPDLFTGFGGTGEAVIGARRFHEYYETSAALSVAAVLIVVVLVACLIAVVRRRALRDRTLVSVMLLMLPCLAFWWLVMFQTGGTVVHQGSHVWILLLIALPFAWIAVRSRWVAFSALALQVLLTAWFYIPFFGHDAIRPAAVLVALFGCVVVAAGVAVSRSQPSAEPAVSEPARIGEALSAQ
jgi:hypothetical protein